MGTEFRAGGVMDGSTKTEAGYDVTIMDGRRAAEHQHIAVTRLRRVTPSLRAR
jgi:hypothetical protein